MKKRSIGNDILDFLIGISFVMSVYVNMIAYYLTGNQNDLVRTVISWTAILVIVVILGGYVIKKWFSSDKQEKKNIWLYMSPLLINGVLLVWALIDSGINSYVFKQCICFGAYCVPVVCGAIYIVLEKRFDAVVSKIKYVTLTMSPFYCIALFYLGSLTTTSPVEREIGGVVYLSIGYSVLPMYAGLVYDLIINFMAQKKSKIKIALILVEMVICSLMSIISSSRGVLIGWFVINLIAVGIMLVKKQRAGMLGITVSVAAVLTFCIVAPADNMSLGRQLEFINDIKQGKLEQSLKSEEGQQLLNDLYEQADGEQGILQIAQGIREDVHSETSVNGDAETGTSVNGDAETGTSVDGDAQAGTSANGDAQAGTSVDGDAQASTNTKGDAEVSTNVKGDVETDTSVNEEYKDALYSITNGSMARSYLWQLAIKEMKQSPLTGIGPMGYQQKYGSHTHNIVLECLADFGIIACGIMGVVCAAAIILLIKKGLCDWKYCGVLMIISGEIVHAMLSGDLYVCPFLLFTLVFAIEIMIEQRKTKKIANSD